VIRSSRRRRAVGLTAALAVTGAGLLLGLVATLSAWAGSGAGWVASLAAGAGVGAGLVIPLSALGARAEPTEEEGTRRKRRVRITAVVCAAGVVAVKGAELLMPRTARAADMVLDPMLLLVAVMTVVTLGRRVVAWR
jgi:hypothetical protein